MSLPKDRAAAAKAAPTIDVKDISAVEAEIARLNQSLKESENSQKRYVKSLNEWQTTTKVAGDKVAGLEAQVSKLNDEFEQNKSKNVQNAYASLRSEAEKLGADLSGIPLDYTEQGLE
jgi:chromosome segregation ATPase